MVVFLLLFSALGELHFGSHELMPSDSRVYVGMEVIDYG